MRTLAVGAGVAPVLAPLGSRFLGNAHAGVTGAPRRLILFENPNGLPGAAGIPDEWFFKPGPTFRAGTFGHVLKPLERHRDNMVVLQNLEMHEYKKQGPGISDHGKAVGQLYTGSIENGPNKSPTASIDYHLGETIGKLVTPRFPTLYTGIQGPGESHTRNYAGAVVRYNQNPYDLYAKLFTNLVKPGQNAGLLDRLANRQSVLDYVAKDLAELQRRLGSDDRKRAEMQLGAIRTLEKRLIVSGDGSSCQAPVQRQGLVWEFPKSQDVPQLSLVMNDLVVAALACDLTRIAIRHNWGGDHAQATCNFAPVNTTQGWHSLSHADPSFDAFRRAKVWLSGVVADLADKLAAIPEAGGTMLDNTLILMAADHGQDHREHGLLLCTIGGKNLGVKVGTHLVCGENRLGGGVEHNRLLVSLLNLMGSPEEKWGEGDRGKGPLPGFAS